LDDDLASAAALASFHATYGGTLKITFESLRLRWKELLDLHFPRFLAGEMSMQEQRRARMVDLFRPAKLNLSAAEADAAFVVFEKTYRGSWRAFPDAAPCLAALGRYKLAVLTNGDLEQQRAKLQAAGLGSYFRNVFVSSDIGYAKPNRAAFLVSCARLGCRAEPLRVCRRQS
jgi:putative hydrolase of the HAD superfamily